MHHEHHEHHDMFLFPGNISTASKSPPGRNLIRDSGKLHLITTATDHPGFLFPVVQNDPHYSPPENDRGVFTIMVTWPQQEQKRDQDGHWTDSFQRTAACFLTATCWSQTSNTRTAPHIPHQLKIWTKKTSTTTARRQAAPLNLY